ncbi:hypothetical protein SIM91_43650 [Rhodococcus opacus]|uniref:hypothetical protein n=1 Tax=Rhodococcus opacus TaxID=37919 RepID=UPI0002A30CCE|nr:hypothetical protein [Rhodococcus opacus]ELB86052.1 hypothetical protein Rwratislav_46970 [Rhodococcus wratislaviensis IFP 2016]MDX5970056.1 hypothetical protein [Rhodococcus opacus]CAG7634333.1 hypothetical protein E143388_07593 [Rhodococcus opacus]
MTEFLDTDDVLTVGVVALRHLPDVRDYGLLAAAVARPEQSEGRLTVARMRDFRARPPGGPEIEICATGESSYRSVVVLHAVSVSPCSLALWTSWVHPPWVMCAG